MNTQELQQELLATISGRPSTRLENVTIEPVMRNARLEELGRNADRPSTRLENVPIEPVMRNNRLLMA